MNCIQTDGFDLNILNLNTYEKHIKADTVWFEVHTDLHKTHTHYLLLFIILEV